MDLTFLGHQTWLISQGNTHVLLDPILEPRFGHSPGVDFRVYPPRKIDTRQMPRVAAAILSHEHLDHFHLPSLDLLPRETPFYVGHLLPACVSRAIEALGFKVHRMAPGKPFQVGELELTLYPGSRETAFWERRVTQVLATRVGAPEDSIFIAVDALMSEEYAQLVKAKELPLPRALVVANNSQFPPPRAVGAYSNLLPLPENGRIPSQFPGLAILHSLMMRYQEELGDIPYTVLCGNGFVSMSESFGPYLFSDNKRLAQMANELSLEPRAFGPYPGERLRIEEGGVEVSEVDWIQLDRPEMQALLDKQRSFMRTPVQPPCKPIMGEFERPEEARAAIQRLEAELVHMARGVMLSKVGNLALATDEYLRGPVGPRRILFRFHEGTDKPVHQYALDFTEGRFVRDDTPDEDMLEVFPFGVELHLKDFCAVLEGRLQIWDLCGNTMRSWFLGSVYENLVVYFFENYGEQVRQDLAWKVYSAALERLKSGGHAREGHA